MDVGVLVDVDALVEAGRGRVPALERTQLSEFDVFLTGQRRGISQGRRQAAVEVDPALALLDPLSRRALPGRVLGAEFVTAAKGHQRRRELALALQHQAELAMSVRVTRFEFDRRAERRDGQGQLSLVPVDEAQLVVCVSNLRIEFEGLLNGRDGLWKLVLLAKDHPEGAVSFRTTGIEFDRSSTYRFGLGELLLG